MCVKLRRRGGSLTQAVGAVHGETHEDDISVGVGEGPQPVVVLLTRRVPEGQLHLQHHCITAREITARGGAKEYINLQKQL